MKQSRIKTYRLTQSTTINDYYNCVQIINNSSAQVIVFDSVPLSQGQRLEIRNDSDVECRTPITVKSVNYNTIDVSVALQIIQ